MKQKPMKPKEKAKELVDKFETLTINFPYIDTVDGQCIGTGYMTHNSAICCAIIAIALTNGSKEVLNELITMK